jgi:hypothetical protein
MPRKKRAGRNPTVVMYEGTPPGVRVIDGMQDDADDPHTGVHDYQVGSEPWSGHTDIAAQTMVDNGDKRPSDHLIDVLKDNHTVAKKYNIQQIIAICGDGRLRDESTCSNQFRGFLEACNPGQLETHIRYCLEEKFDSGGFALQDLVNEVGTRLGYQVVHGRYRGTTNAIGFDGLWFDGKSYLLVEVKTTDAYRINLDTVCAYGEKLKDAHIDPKSKIDSLIVVGRQDTGDLEAQVRGSRHAWSARIISAEALVKLMHLNYELDDPKLLAQVRTILHPFEYTRVDEIIEMVFGTRKDTSEVVVEAPAPQPEKSKQPPQVSRPLELTPKADLEAKRASIVSAFFAQKGSQPLKKSKTNFSDVAGGLRVSCAVSKRYDSDYQPYWYALHPAWTEFLEGGKDAYFILGCMDRNDAFAIPFSKVKEQIPSLNRTEKDDRSYWHVALNLEAGVLKWNISQAGQKLDLTPYKFKLI